MKQTRKELRQIALGAVRSELRKQGRSPQAVDANVAYAVLDNIFRTDKQSLAAVWYDTASDNDRNKFFREWEKYA